MERLVLWRKLLNFTTKRSVLGLGSFLGIIFVLQCLSLLHSSNLFSPSSEDPVEMPNMPRKTIPEMRSILAQNRASSLPPPQWPLESDRELSFARTQIENAPTLKDDPHLYAPIFRNISRFKRSYELMEIMLKVYVYEDGEKPIFHKPELDGVYCSEGWFMKLMESSSHFVVKNSTKAHLFYIPFGSRILRVKFRKHRHNRRDMVEHLKKYVDSIATTYPFWNRTGGADHFFTACHDWAPDVTRHSFHNSIRALCNADLSEGFQLGKDASLPVTFIHSANDVRMDLGGEPPYKRQTLAFYAGSRHGQLRENLLLHWENKDPAMKFLGPGFFGRLMSEKTYRHHMKTSKYCICPRGYGSHSPRVVEAIYYECVPVIISDNYVPPFFEIFNWEAFAIFVAESEIPKLKDILLSIPEEKYLNMQMMVKKVQQHFLWHANPVKYDVFHMILHSVWLNRLYQARIS